MNHRSLPSVRVHDSLFLSPKSEKFIFLVVIGYENGSNFVAFATQLWRPLSWSLRPSYLTGLGPWTSMDSASKSLELACSLGLVLIHASAITMRTCPDKPAGEWETCEAKLSHPSQELQPKQPADLQTLEGAQPMPAYRPSPWHVSKRCFLLSCHWGIEVRFCYAVKANSYTGFNFQADSLN